jgi:hypothetical protein
VLTTLFCGRNIAEVYMMVVAALEQSKVLTGPIFLMFDGEAELSDEFLMAMREYAPGVVCVLDWFHLKKKTYESLSMALRCSLDEKKTIRSIVLEALFMGNVEWAIAFLSSLDGEDVNKGRMADYYKYLKRKRRYIINYRLRQSLGYKISSQSVEGANNLLVASRQKRGGAWSVDGSVAMATLTAAERNNLLNAWLHNPDSSDLIKHIAAHMIELGDMA